MVEQLTLNQRVVGSSPTRFTTEFKAIIGILPGDPELAVPVTVPVAAAVRRWSILMNLPKD